MNVRLRMYQVLLFKFGRHLLGLLSNSVVNKSLFRSICSPYLSHSMLIVSICIAGN